MRVEAVDKIRIDLEGIGYALLCGCLFGSIVGLAFVWKGIW